MPDHLSSGLVNETTSGGSDIFLTILRILSVQLYPFPTFIADLLLAVLDMEQSPYLHATEVYGGLTQLRMGMFHMCGGYTYNRTIETPILALEIGTQSFVALDTACNIKCTCRSTLQYCAHTLKNPPFS